MTRDPLSPLGGFPRRPDGGSRATGSVAFAVGVVLIAVSYLVYPGYAVLPMLGLTARGIAAGAFTLWISSWALFVVGTLLAGKEGVFWLRDVLRNLYRRRNDASPE